MGVTTENGSGLPEDVIEGIDAEIDRRFLIGDDDPLYAEIRRVCRAEMIQHALERGAE